MVMTVLEAKIPQERIADLNAEFRRQTSDIPPQMVETFLVQGVSDPTLWRAISVWRSREALDEMRRSTTTPAGVLIFRAAGAEPTLAIFDVVANIRP